MKHDELRKLYGQLKGIKDLFNSTSSFTVSKTVGDDYNQIVSRASQIIGEDISSFQLGPGYYNEAYGGKLVCDILTIKEKLYQLISYLEHGYNVSEKVIEIGSIYNSINDDELKGRCSDILTAPGNFDRVINQATQVLEDRIRKKSGSSGNNTGTKLVNTALNADIDKTILEVSTNKEEHEGVCHICRGIMLAFRNPTHHHLTDQYSREDALKFCAFIDNILFLIDHSKKKN